MVGEYRRYKGRPLDLDLTAPRETWLINRVSITLPMSKTLPSFLFLRKGTLVPIPINSLEPGADMVLPRNPCGFVSADPLYETLRDVE